MIAQIRANMTPLKKTITLRTAFADYEVTHVIGEGGAGRVYRATEPGTGELAAIKVLTGPTSDKRKRFKNETAFLAKAKHPNLVPVLASGIAEGDLDGPFYVMPLYEGSLRDLLGSKLNPEFVMRAFSQILDGVEAAHLMGATHRDLKPENVLFEAGGESLVVADFGVASFTAEDLRTLVETKPTQRLANFAYASPEQRAPGRPVSQSADIWALGLMLNEMFTGEVPHGRAHQTVASIAPEYGFLDPVIARMISQNPDDRPQSIAVVKGEIEKYRADFISRQRLDELSRQVVPEGEVTDPLALRVPQIVGVHWDDGVLSIDLDMDLNARWIRTFQFELGNYTSVLGSGPENFTFSGRQARVPVREHSAQNVINHVKDWLPKAKEQYRRNIESEIADRKRRQEVELAAMREKEERRLRVNSGLQF